MHKWIYAALKLPKNIKITISGGPVCVFITADSLYLNINATKMTKLTHSDVGR